MQVTPLPETLPIFVAFFHTSIARTQNTRHLTEKEYAEKLQGAFLRSFLKALSRHVNISQCN